MRNATICVGKATAHVAGPVTAGARSKKRIGDRSGNYKPLFRAAPARYNKADNSTGRCNSNGERFQYACKRA